MFKTEKLRALVNDRLKAAAEQILRLFEETIKDYEEDVFRYKQEMERQRRSGWKDRTQSVNFNPLRAVSSKTCSTLLQVSVQEEDGPPEQNQHEMTADDLKPVCIKEEREAELWVPQGCETHEEADSKDSMFNIVYVQRGEEGGRGSPHQSHIAENKGDSCLSSCLSQLGKEDCASEPTSDSLMSEVSDSEWRDSELHSAVHRKKLQEAGEAADRPYTCSVCNKNFRIKSILTRHMKTHTGEKPHSCSVCGKSFIQRCYLQTHVNSHSGQKPYTCSFCGRGFTQVSNMNAHTRIHTGEKPHSCTDCGKRFREKADLVKHTIIHSGEKPYSCTVCNIRFSAQSNLTRHMKTHSGERPYSCTVCEKRFIRRSHLIIHMKTHTEEES